MSPETCLQSGLYLERSVARVRVWIRDEPAQGQTRCPPRKAGLVSSDSSGRAAGGGAACPERENKADIPTSQLRGSGRRADSPQPGAEQPREGPQQSRVREGTGSGPWGTNSSLFKQQTQTKTHRHTPKPPVTPLCIPSQQMRGLRSLTGAIGVKREGRN